MSAYSVGDWVEHDKFGRGFIVDIEGEGDKAEVIVRFGDVGEKRLLLAWAPLRKAVDQNGASAKKPGVRGMAKKTVALRSALYPIVAEQQPMTVRQVYYQATVRHLVPKTEPGYRQVCRQLLEMRRDHVIPYEWISDNTRWMRKPRTYSSLSDMLDQSVNFYRRALWDDQADYVEIWCEKDALAGVIIEETDPYDVPLMVSRGFASESFLFAAATNIAARGKPAHIYLASDYDGAGLDLARSIDKGLRRLAPGANITFERIGVVPDQVDDWDAVARPPKPKDRGRPEFANGCVELDALPPLQLRSIIRKRIEAHIDVDALAAVGMAARLERETLDLFSRAWRANGADINSALSELAVRTSQ